MADYGTRKSNDLRKEKNAHGWLEFVLWNKFPDYRSNSDRETQLKGVDCEFTGKSGFHYICDEKAVTGEMYINQPLSKKLKTFCLELSMRAKKGGEWQRYTGWFLNENEINNSYCLVWIDRTKSGSVNSVDDILEAEVVIVRKDAIWDWLKSKGWDKEKLEAQVEEILANPENYNKSVDINGVRFSHPVRLRDDESPVNILLTREDYVAMSDFHKIYKFD